MDEQERKLEMSKSNQDYSKGNCENKQTLENDSGRLIATLEITLNKLNDIIEQQTERIKELERPLKATGFKVDGMLAVGNELSRQDKRIKELEADIENRRKYETYLQSSEHPVYSYAVWLNQQALKGNPNE